MSFEQKLGSSGAIQHTTKCDEIIITEFHTSNNNNELVYAITCDCVCVG